MDLVKELHSARIKGAKDFAESLKLGLTAVSDEMMVSEIPLEVIIEIIDIAQNQIS